MILDKACFERGCACYGPRFDTDVVDLNKTGWIRAVDEEMTATHLGIASIDDTYEVAKRKLNALIEWHITLNTEPDKVEHIMKLVEAYRTSGGSEEHHARKEILRQAIERIVK